MKPDSKKRPQSPTLIPNPFVKKRNLEWTLHSPTPAEPATPLQLSPPSPSTVRALVDLCSKDQTSTAIVESGTVEVRDHLTYFSSYLSRHVLNPCPPDTPTLSIPSYISLYQANVGSPYGSHFVIHQHDHPVAGTHYDLRLQINQTSSVSWAIMYGLPGDPNSVRLNRNATETRIHSLWNHLIETASSATGSLLIWDTGTYTILPRRSKHDPIDDPSSPPGSPSSNPSSPLPPQSLLHTAFQNRKIRLQLHGTKLPAPYVLNLRLTKSEDASGRVKSKVSGTKTPRRRRRPRIAAQPPQLETSCNEDETEEESDTHLFPITNENQVEGNISATDREIRELEDEETRRTNAYPGSSNTIGSIHQRKWYLSLDRPACGFIQRKRQGRSTAWEIDKDKQWGTRLSQHDNIFNEHNGEEGGQASKVQSGKQSRSLFPFYVRGPDHERSVVTGRRGVDIMQDEGVTDFVQRKGWKPVVN